MTIARRLTIHTVSLLDFRLALTGVRRKGLNRAARERRMAWSESPLRRALILRRAEIGMSLSTLAEAGGYSRSSFYTWERALYAPSDVQLRDWQQALQRKAA